MRKKIKRVFVILGALIVVGICVISYYNYLPNPNTNLEFWICEKVEKSDFSGYQQKNGVFGARKYYGTGYIPTQLEGELQMDSEVCVIYTVTAYPDYCSIKTHVTEISITDPKIEIYGLTMNSSFDEIKETLKKKGFRFEENNNSLIAIRGKYKFKFSSNVINISVNVTNIFRIQF